MSLFDDNNNNNEERSVEIVTHGPKVMVPIPTQVITRMVVKTNEQLAGHRDWLANSLLKRNEESESSQDRLESSLPSTVNPFFLLPRATTINPFSALTTTPPSLSERQVSAAQGPATFLPECNFLIDAASKSVLSQVSTLKSQNAELQGSITQVQAAASGAVAIALSSASATQAVQLASATAAAASLSGELVLARATAASALSAANSALSLASSITKAILGTSSTTVVIAQSSSAVLQTSVIVTSSLSSAPVLQTSIIGQSSASAVPITASNSNLIIASLSAATSSLSQALAMATSSASSAIGAVSSSLLAVQSSASVAVASANSVADMARASATLQISQAQASISAINQQAQATVAASQLAAMNNIRFALVVTFSIIGSSLLTILIVVLIIRLRRRRRLNRQLALKETIRRERGSGESLGPSLSDFPFPVNRQTWSQRTVDEKRDTDIERDRRRDGDREDSLTAVMRESVPIGYIPRPNETSNQNRNQNQNPTSNSRKTWAAAKNKPAGNERRKSEEFESVLRGGSRKTWSGERQRSMSFGSRKTVTLVYDVDRPDQPPSFRSFLDESMKSPRKILGEGRRERAEMKRRRTEERGDSTTRGRESDGSEIGTAF